MKEDSQLLFSEKEISEAKARLPAISHYQRMLNRTPNTELDQLRLDRHRHWLNLAIGSFHQENTQKELMKQWSQYFIHNIPLILEIQKQQYNESNLVSEFGVLALGKLGAQELNLSSDIDLIYIHNQESEAQDLARKFTQVINESTEFGFLHRVDLGLRPGGINSPLVQNLHQMESYYFHHGETWERLALMRLLVIHGTPELKDSVKFIQKKFCFRKHIDYNILEELSLLRSRIHLEHRQKFATQSDKVHLKLSPGGIRDIELFIQSLCLLHGGRNEHLASPQTDIAIQNLVQFQILPKTEADFLIEHYWKLRRAENLAQAENDQQTHSLSPKDWRISLCFNNEANFKKNMQTCFDIVNGFLKIRELRSQLPEEFEEQKKYLHQKGFSIASIDKNWPEIIKATALSKKSERDESIRKEVLDHFLHSIEKNAYDKELSFAILRDFFKSIRAKASLFRFFQMHPQIIDDLAFLFGMSPYLSTKICSRPELIDNLVFRAQASPPTDFEQVLEFLADHKQLGEILYGLDYARDRNLNILTKNLSNMADYITRSLLSICTEDPSLNILKLGKWGGNELGLQSDLDFIFVYEGNKIPEEAFKSARKFLSLMGANYKAGRLYDIDIRLRPSGKAGPILVSMQKLQSYLKERAEAWELQAYLRASFLNGEEKNLLPFLYHRQWEESTWLSLDEIREKLQEQNSHPSKIHLKYQRGGLIHIELFCQKIALKHQWQRGNLSNFSLLEQLGSFSPQALKLAKHYQFLRSIEQGIALLRQGQSMELGSQDPLYPKLEKLFGLSFSLENELQRVLTHSEELLLDLNREF